VCVKFSEDFSEQRECSKKFALRFSKMFQNNVNILSNVRRGFRNVSEQREHFQEYVKFLETFQNNVNILSNVRRGFQNVSEQREHLTSAF
jgi:HJR/Mrr/RecB family endonuclease